MLPAGGHGLYQYGGAERAVAELTGALVERGLDVHVAAPARYFSDAPIHRNVVQHSFDPYHGAIRTLRGILASVHPEVLTAHLLRGILLGVPVARLARTPTVITILHNSLSATFETDPPSAARQLAYRSGVAALTRAWTDATIALSETNRADLIARDKLPPSKVRTVHPWVSDRFDLTRAAEWRATRRADLGVTNEPLIGVVGRLASQKAQDRIITMLPFLPRARLVLLGSGPRHDSLVAAAEVSKVAGRVTFAGFKRDIETWMAACDVIAVPSVFEGFGRVAIEALALGIPVVASDTTGLGATLRDAPRPGVWLVRGDDQSEWLSALNEAIAASTPHVRNALGEFARTHYALNSSVAEFLSVVSEFHRRAT